MNLTRAAQYLRMSTEHQLYSLENQSAANQRYADQNGFSIVKTYSDAARSGLLFRNREALKKLLQDIIGGKHGVSALLVYDVSRWGRFQDCDEAAHYEFVCRNAGVPVYYCAEIFANDNSLSARLMKAVKRAMAAEYSRDLGDRVFTAAKSWAALGFKQGGPAGYGFGRVVLSGDGKRKEPLKAGEIKCLQSDRVVLCPGDPIEVQYVREIFRLVVEEGKTPFRIAQELNHRGMLHRGRPWVHQNVQRILTDPKYAGANVWNRNSRRLGGPCVPNSRSEWVVIPGAFEPIVNPRFFEEAQKVLARRTCSKSNEQVIDDLRKLLAEHGKLTEAILNSATDAPSPSGCRKRFGTLRRAFDLAGYSRSAPASPGSDGTVGPPSAENVG